MATSKRERTPDVVVLPGTHSLPIEQYVDAIRERLPQQTVVHARTPHQATELIADAPVATGETFDEALLDVAADLRLFACTSAGTDRLPLELARERGIAVTNASGVHEHSIAEHVVGWMLAFARRHHEGWRRNRRREWRRYPAGTLQGSTATIVGLGAIGTAIAERLRPFGVDSIGVRRSPGDGGPTDEVIAADRDHLRDALSRTEYLVLACPLTDATRGLIGETELACLPTDAVVVNVARGAVVDTDALTAALQYGHVRGAALDVTDPEPLPPDHPLWRLENVFITAHMAGYAPDVWTRRASILARNLRTAETSGEYTDLENQVVDPGSQRA